MAQREIIPTQSAYLELKEEEKDGMQEGYRFLDEKRLILASEILEQFLLLRVFAPSRERRPRRNRPSSSFALFAALRETILLLRTWLA